MAYENTYFCEAEYPLRITGIQYELYLTHDEVEARKQELEQNHSSRMVVVPFYDEEGLFDPTYIEVLAVREFCPTFLFEDDCRFGAARWRYDGSVFRAGVYLTEGTWMLRRMHRMLGTEIPAVMHRESEARAQLYQQNREAYLRIDMQSCAAWAEAHIQEMKNQPETA